MTDTPQTPDLTIAHDGLTNGKFRVMMDRVGSSERTSYAINLEHRF
jgi:hypothetical protein